MKLDRSKACILKLLLMLFIVLVIYGTSDEKYALNGSIGNYAKGYSSGIYLIQSNNNSIVENSVIGNRVGINLVMSDNSTIKENIVSDNSEYGLFLEDSNCNIIYRNNIYRNVYSGISIWDSQNNLIKYNMLPIIVMVSLFGTQIVITIK